MIDLHSKETIREYFINIGYEGNSIFDFDKSNFSFTYDWLKKVHLISNTDDFNIWLFDIEEIKTEYMNLIAHRLFRRNPFDYNLLIFTDSDYKNTVFLHYHRGNDGKIKIRRLKIEKNRLTATDLRILSEIKITGKDIIDDLDIAKIHQNAFDIERVTEKFFEEFKVQIEYFTQHLKGIETYTEKKNYALLILCRLIFLYFVQQKGWLNGVKNYLYDRFQYCLHNNLNFFEEILKPLFFECLNTPHEDLLNKSRSESARKLYDNYTPFLEDIEVIEDFHGIPYLNGGLFEVNPHYELNTDIHIKNDVFKKLFEELLNKYNFTVREDLGYDTDIAVDPELLGRIFENMIIEEERSNTGSFYTPRNIINEICKNSLIKFFSSKLAFNLYEKFEYLIINLEDDNLYAKNKKIFLDNINTEIRDCSIFKFTKNEAINILKEIDHLKICDPAVGSGAFILGMLHILVEIIRKISLHSLGHRINIFETKSKIIKENLYGVDREEGAIDIARLRIWLSLSVEFNAETIEDIKPLPNLAYKITQGNSLFSSINDIDLDKEFDKLGYGGNKKQVSLFEKRTSLHLIIDELISKKGKFFNATIDKKEMEGEIKQLEKELVNSMISSSNSKTDEINSRNLFSWKINFPEVFEKKGFDIIIGNPPYGAEFSNFEKEFLKSRYPNVADFESSQYFYLRGLELLKPNGVICYITTNTFLFNVNAKKYRKEILTSSILDGIYDLTEVSVFKKAKVRTVIKYGIKLNSKNYDLRYFVFNTEIEQFYYKNKKPIKDLLNNDKKWLFMMRFSEEQEKLIERISSKGSPLCKDFYVCQGLIPYDKYKGHSPEIIKNRIWHSDYHKDETYKPELKGEDVKNYIVKWNGKVWISYGEWLAAPREPKFFTSPRVLVREIVDKNTGRLNAGYTADEFYNTPSIINIIQKPERRISLFYILGLLNSGLFAIYNYGTSPKVKKGLFPKVLVTDIRGLPIKKGNKRQISMMEEFVKQIISILINEKNKKEIEEIQLRIDQLTFEIYGISNDEQKILHSIIH